MNLCKIQVKFTKNNCCGILFMQTKIFMVLYGQLLLYKIGRKGNIMKKALITIFMLASVVFNFSAYTTTVEPEQTPQFTQFTRSSVDEFWEELNYYRVEASKIYKIIKESRDVSDQDIEKLVEIQNAITDLYEYANTSNYRNEIE